MKKIKIIPTTENANFFSIIKSAKNFIPEWYKKSPQKVDKNKSTFLNIDNPSQVNSTYKKCSPFLDAITNGYIFCLSQDIEVIKKEDGSPYIVWRDDFANPVTWHTNDQWAGLVYPEDCHNFVYKWENYFIIKTPKKYSTLFTHPHNRFDLPFKTLSGVVDTDKYNLPVHFPFFLKNNFVGIIKAGTPLVQITFIKREGWFKRKLKYNKNFIKKEKFIFFSHIDRAYKNFIWQKKQYEDE